MPRKRQTTKSRIVKAAWNLFYKKGYHATTIDDIITASRTSKGSFYHYFKGKDALLGSLAYLFDDKYEELVALMDPTLSAADKLLYLNYELFLMIETSVDMELLTLLYSSQLTTKDQRALLDDNRFYFTCIREIVEDAQKRGEFTSRRSADELIRLYTMYERSLIYDWLLCQGSYSLSKYSAELLPGTLAQFLTKD